MKLGITGLPKSGKTTVFEVLTQSFSETRRKMEHRIGTIKVPDQRVDILGEMYKPKKTVLAQVEYYLPGKMAKKKDQIWNQVRDSDALIHVIRNFEAYGQEKQAPVEDFYQADQELMLADQMVVEKRLENLRAEKKRGRKVDQEEFGLLEQCLEQLESETPLRKIPELASAHALKGFTFLSAKPVLVLFNNGDESNEFPDLKDLVEKEDCMVIRAKLEHEIAQMSEEDASDFLEEYQIKALAVDRIIEKSYDLLGLISFFTVGEDEVRAWTIRKGTLAIDAAEVIHSDIKKGFIRAEVLCYNDLMDAGNYQEAKKKGNVRLEGKNYLVKNGDIINFRFNV